MATIKDVARLAGVSAMTVSRAINTPDQVSPKTQSRIQTAIDKLDYRPNFLARSLVRRYSKLVGVLYTNGYNETYIKQISGIEKTAKERNYEIILSNVTNYESLVSGVDTLGSMQVDGYIILPLELDNINTLSKGEQSYNDLLKAYDFLDSYFNAPDSKPCVFIGTEIQAHHVRHVIMDYFQGGGMALSILLEAGVQNVALLTSHWDKGIWKIRTDAYIKGMRDAGYEKYIRVERTERSVVGGYDCMCNLLEKKNLPDAFLCGNDYMAIGAMQALLQAGVKVPQEIKIVGQDGLDLGGMIYPKLTTVDMQGVKSGEEAMKLLQMAIEDTNEEQNNVIITPKNIIRHTT